MREGDPRPAGGAVARNPFVACLLFLVAASGAVLLVLGSEITFYSDEWGVLLNRRDWSADAIFNPYNDHIAVTLVAIYKLLLVTFGMDSALPFQVIATLVFLLSAVLLFAYLHRRVGGWPALLGSALVLFLGAAWIDLLWAFQIGFSGAIAAGLGALLALDRNDAVGDRIACALLVLSVSFSELGVPFVAGALVGVLWVRPRAWIPRLYIVGVPVVLYAIWWLGWGHEAPSEFSFENVVDSPVWVFEAVSQAMASLFGLATPLTGSGFEPVGLIWGQILLVVGIAAAVWRFWRLGEVPRTFWVALAIGGSFWFLTAFNTVPLLREPTSGRYQYPGAVFLLLIAAEVLRGVRVSTRAMVVGSVVTGFAVLSGLWFLHLGQSNNLKPQSEELRASLASLELARDRVQLGVSLGSGLVPIEAHAYLSAADALGSPAYSPSELATSPERARVAADVALVQALGIALGGPPGSPSGPPDRPERCRVTRATPTGATGITLGPGEVTLKPASGATVEVLLARFADGYPAGLGPLAPETSALTLPPDRSRRQWRLGLLGAAPVTVCAAGAP